MGKLQIYFKKKKKNKNPTFPFNILSSRHITISSKHLSDRTKYRLCTNILFYFISNLVILQSVLKNSVSCVFKNFI